jgi:hypothetical protein
MTSHTLTARGRACPRAFACPPWFAGLLLTGVLVAPGSAPAERGGDALQPVPVRRGIPRLEAMALDASSAAAAESLAARLGFATVRHSTAAWRVVAPFARGALLWYDARHDASFGERTDGRPLPLTRLLVAVAPAQLPLARWRDADGVARDGEPAHPNGALELTGAFALVPDFDIACERWKEFGSECDLGEGRLLAEVGGMTRVAPSEGGFYAFVEALPGRADALRRIAERGNGWIGFNVSVRDADATAAFLERQGVPHIRGTRSGPGARLWVLPEHAGGAMIGFVQQARNARAGR